MILPCNMYVYFLFVLIALRSVSCAEHPLGHNKPLGSHTKPGDIEVLNDFPTPTEFYHNYVKTGRPVLFKSVMNSGFPAFEKWTDSYLRKTYGQETVDMERGKKETREGVPIEKTFSGFLDNYGKEDIYMVQDIFQKMKSEIGVPRCLQCGGFQNQLTMSILWFSSGGTKSVLHLDTFDNINCLLDGTKDLVFFDKSYQSAIEAVDYVEDGSYSRIDVDRVDLYKTPHFSFLPWFKATMKKGDCLFIPWRWYHQVNSFEKRNFAVNLWFNHLFWFNETDCETNKDLKQFKLLDNFKMSSFIETIRNAMIGGFGSFQTLTQDDIKKHWGELPALFDSLDLNKDSTISLEEMYSFNVIQFLKKYGKDIMGFGVDFWNELEQLANREVQKSSSGSLIMLSLIQNLKEVAEEREAVTSNDFSSKDEF